MNGRAVMLAVMALWAAGCPGPGPGGQRAPRAVTAGSAAAGTELPAARILRVEVDEQNLLLAGRSAAESYLRQKLVALLARRLAELGFDSVSAARLAARAELLRLEVDSRRARVRAGGEESGPVVEKRLWRVRGRVRLVLEEPELQQLCRLLERLPLDTVAAAEAMRGFLARLQPLQPPGECRDELRRKLARDWAAALQPEIAALAGNRRQSDFASLLAAATGRVADLAREFPEHPRLDEFQNRLGKAWWSWLRELEPSAATGGKLDERLAKLRQAAAGLLPKAEKFVYQALELAWRDSLNRRDDRHRPFPELREDFLEFLRRFPSSRFYPEMELRFVARWLEHLRAARPGDLSSLQRFGEEAALLRKSFPGLEQGGEIWRRYGQHCLELLGKIGVADLKQLEQVQRQLGRCDPALPAGAATLAVRQRLDEIAARLHRQQRDRQERSELTGLTFFLEWDRLLRQQTWNLPVAVWPGRGALAARWQQGQEAGAECSCSLDAAEPCRSFEREGSHGGYEVVGRLFAGKVIGIDLCNVYVGEQLPAVYRFLKRRYRSRHRARQAAALLGSGNGEVAFGPGHGLLVWLSCQEGICTLRVRQAQAYRRQQRQADEQAEQLRAQRRQQRTERLQKGWQAGDCVRWECQAGCLFQGRVEARQDDRYQVVVLRSADEARLVGDRLWVDAEELYDCR